MIAPLATLLFALSCGVLLWLLSLRLKDVSIIDIFWGPGIAAVVDISALLGPAPGMRSFLVLFLVNGWALRLALHIWARHRGEDHRYGAMRKTFGPRWWWWSFFQVFLLQIILIWFLPVPLVAALRRREAPGRASATLRHIASQFEDDQNGRSLNAATMVDALLLVPLFRVHRHLL